MGGGAEVESLKRETGEIDFIERSSGMGILACAEDEDKKICVWPFFCTQKHRGCKVLRKVYLGIILYSSSTRDNVNGHFQYS